MKENGMEKLIKLLNEYLETFDTETNRTSKVYAFEEATKSFIAENGTSYRQERVISKRFKFIKWLVENDKIDFSLIPNKIKEIGIPMKINGEIKYGFDSSDYYWLLMLLSISDTPIDDLISYLK